MVLTVSVSGLACASVLSAGFHGYRVFLVVREVRLDGRVLTTVNCMLDVKHKNFRTQRIISGVIDLL